MKEEVESINNEIENDDFRNWKKNSPYFYDLSISHILEWPSLTCQFLPEYSEDNDFKYFKILLGTYTSDNYPNFLMIGNLRTPTNKYLEELKLSNKDINKINDNKLNCFEIDKKIYHNGEILKARYMPQKYNIIATKDNFGNLNIFDYNNHQKIPIEKEPVFKPELVLKTDEEDKTFGLNWSSLKEGLIASSGSNSKIKIWDINSNNTINKELQPSVNYSMKTSVNDIIFHKFHDQLLFTTNEEGIVNFFDLRTNKSFVSLLANDSEIFSIETSPFNEYLMLTGSSQGKISLFDLRYLKEEVNNYIHHNNGINKLEFSPFKENIFSSISLDKKVCIWDISNLEDEENKNHNKQSELVICHEGHRGIVSDFSWSDQEEWLCASTEEENNTIQFWKMSEEIYYN